jgi:hypothetical protein
VFAACAVSLTVGDGGFFVAEGAQANTIDGEKCEGCTCLENTCYCKNNACGKPSTLDRQRWDPEDRKQYTRKGNVSSSPKSLQ